MASAINLIFGKAFDLLLYPVHNLNPWVGMTIISVLVGVLMLLIYRYTSNQDGIRRVKDKIKAHLFELRLYSDNFPVTMKAQKAVLGYNAKYLYYNLKPMLVMFVPIVLMLIQMDLWFGYRPLKPGESVLLKVNLDQSPLQSDLTLQPPAGVKVETPPLRIEDEKEIDWRLKGVSGGTQALTFSVNGQSFTKQIVVSGRPFAKISRARVGNQFLDRILHPGEPPVPSNVPVTRVEILYPGSEMSFFGLPVHWLIAFFILSIVFGFSLKGVFHVEV